jgi:uncharacterized membrane protein
MEAVRNAMEFAALGIEVMAVATIVVATVHGTTRYLLHLKRQVDDAYRQYKVELGKALLLALEFLVAADIITTVVLEPTLQNVLILGALVTVRTFLSWSLVVEIEGRWPWRGTKSVEGRKEV